MKLVLDCETTTYNKGNPYDRRNSLVSIHAYYGGTKKSYRPSEIESVRELVQQATTIIAFNAKFDFAWLRKCGLVIEKPLWDVQLAHFILRYQTTPFPSLNQVLEFYGLPPKLDVVEKEYWDKDIQTDQIPWEILCEYGEADVEKTYQCYQKQLEEFKQEPKLHKVFRVSCKDTYPLLDMEWNGLKYNNNKCVEKSTELQENIKKLVGDLSSVYPGIPFNFDSPDHVSSYLYGGIIKEEVREVVGVYKTGNKIGAPRYRIKVVEHGLPRLFEPIRGSELKKENMFSTDEATLRKLKGKNKWIISHLLELSKLMKLDGTYYRGLPKINQEMCWEEGILHPTYNQCRVATGRLSSAKPNGQNLSGDILEIFETRYE